MAFPSPRGGELIHIDKDALFEEFKFPSPFGGELIPCADDT